MNQSKVKQQLQLKASGFFADDCNGVSERPEVMGLWVLRSAALLVADADNS